MILALNYPNPVSLFSLERCIVGGVNPFSLQSQMTQNAGDGNGFQGITFPSFSNLFPMNKISQSNEAQKNVTEDDTTIDWSSIHINISQETRNTASTPYVLSCRCFHQTNTKFTLPAFYSLPQESPAVFQLPGWQPAHLADP